MFMITDLLKKIGFSDKESLVYLTLVQRGRMTASQISISTKLNRTTTYSILGGLIEKNLVIEDLGAATSIYLPAPTSSLLDFFENKERDLRKKKELATRAAGEIERLASNQPFQLAKITFVDEVDIESHLIKRTPKWISSATLHDSTWRGFQDSKLLELFPEYFSLLYKKLMPTNAKQELITEDTTIEQSFEKLKYPNRNIKIWQQGYDFTYSTWVLGEYIIMIQTKDQPFYLIEMKDAILAKNLRDIFLGLWNFIPKQKIKNEKPDQ